MSDYPVGSTAKVYQDQDGNDVTLRQLIRLEPEWAHTRIIQCERLEAALTTLEAENTELKALRDEKFPFDRDTVIKRLEAENKALKEANSNAYTRGFLDGQKDSDALTKEEL